MRRDPHLHDLSRDHHHALVLARRAVTAAVASAQEAGEVWGVVLEAFEADLEPHFRVEEQLLLVPLEALGGGALAERTRADHEGLRALVHGGDVDPRERLQAFGELLRDHVRFEERELFPVAEALLSGEQLAAIAEASALLSAACRRRRP